MWFPEYFKRLREDTCELQATASSCLNATDLQYYQDTLYTAIASLPGNIAGALLINIIGGKIQLGMYMYCFVCYVNVRVLNCSCSHTVMKIPFVDSCSQETYLANVSIDALILHLIEMSAMAYGLMVDMV